MRRGPPLGGPLVVRGGGAGAGAANLNRTDGVAVNKEAAELRGLVPVVRQLANPVIGQVGHLQLLAPPRHCAVTLRSRQAVSYMAAAPSNVVPPLGHVGEEAPRSSAHASAQGRREAGNGGGRRGASSWLDYSGSKSPQLAARAAPGSSHTPGVRVPGREDAPSECGRILPGAR